MSKENSENEYGIPIVIRYKNGHLLKCFIKDFYPSQDTFHIKSHDGVTHIIKVNELKAIFFVRSFEGDKYHIESNKFDPEAKIVGKKVGVKFNDGEMLIGTAFSYNIKNKGFFLTPADSKSNNMKVFIVSDAVEKIIFVS